MSPQGRPEGEYRSAQREGALTPQGRPEGEYRSARREGALTPQGRPERLREQGEAKARRARLRALAAADPEKARKGTARRRPREYRSAQREGHP
ncbi:MAG TPA: hypothetical protein VET86_13290 [Casimicrobiaceae bacterium]|nr:hypothetical protein [Casimicrobiaceae bacterium]